MATLARYNQTYADLEAYFRQERARALKQAEGFPKGGSAACLWYQHAGDCLREIQAIEAAGYFGRPYHAPTHWTLETALASWSWRDVARFLTLLPGSESLVNECVTAIGWSRHESIQAPMHRSLVSKVREFVALTEGVSSL